MRHFAQTKQKVLMEIINVENGNFSLNAEMVINANKELAEIKTFDIDKTTDDMGNGYEWIYFKNIKIGNLYFFLNVCFFQKKTKMINFFFSESQIKNQSWDNWNENEEKNNQRKFEEWLNKSIGNKRKFSWGDISSNYDSKGGGSSITINYQLR